MRQLFYEGHFGGELPAGARWHEWTDGKQTLGVVEMDGHCDAEQVIVSLELKGVKWMPNHHADSSTHQRMTEAHKLSGFPHLKPKRF